MGKKIKQIDPNLRNIILLGMVSFFADVSTEMVYPLIPVYLVSMFGVTPAIIGVIEGIAESMSSVLKVFSGYIADKYQHKKPLAFAGYAGGLIYKLLLLVAGSWTGVLFARIIDRIGKGVRTAPRDVLVSENSACGDLGKSFGLHKSLDMAGSALGIFFAWLLVRQGMAQIAYRQIFLLSCIPALLGLVMLVLVKEKLQPVQLNKPRLRLADFRALDKQLKLYLLVTFFFTLGNSSNAFLLLRAQDAGYSATSVILLYLVYNGVSSLLAFPLGRLSDKIGRKSLLVCGYAIYALVYLLFALVGAPGWMLLAFVLYGIYSALTSGAERAFIAEIAPAQLKGTMLGLHATLTGIALLPASIIAGLLWDNIAPAAPFVFGAMMAGLAALILGMLLQNPRKRKEIAL